VALAPAVRPYVRVGRIIPSLPTQPFIGAVQHVVARNLREYRHTKELLPMVGNDKELLPMSLRDSCAVHESGSVQGFGPLRDWGDVSERSAM
jgi:hypothetical protein